MKVKCGEYEGDLQGFEIAGELECGRHTNYALKIYICCEEFAALQDILKNGLEFIEMQKRENEICDMGIEKLSI